MLAPGQIRFGRGSAADPTGGAYDAPSDPPSRIFQSFKKSPTVKVCRTNAGRGGHKRDVGLDHIVAVRPTPASSLSPKIRDMRVGSSTELVYPLSAPEAGLVFPGRIRWSAERESSTWPNTA